MYSILLLNNSKYVFYRTQDDTIYVANDLTTVGNKVAELLDTYTLNQIKVVKNCTITNTITVEENTAPETTTDRK